MPKDNESASNLPIVRFTINTQLKKFQHESVFTY